MKTSTIDSRTPAVYGGRIFFGIVTWRKHLEWRNFDGVSPGRFWAGCVSLSAVAKLIITRWL